MGDCAEVICFIIAKLEKEYKHGKLQMNKNQRIMKGMKELNTSNEKKSDGLIPELQLLIQPLKKF